MRELRAIIFDMDGVIVNSEEAWFRMEFERLGKLIKGWDSDDHARLIGLSVNDAYRLLKREYSLKISFTEYTEFYRSAAEEVYLDMSNLIPGVISFLRELKERKIPTGLATSSPSSWMRMVIRRFSLAEYFDCTVSADDVGGRGKPSPDVYLEAVKCLQIPPTSCMAIEDSTNGIKAALGAKLYTIGFRNCHNLHANLEDSHAIIEGFTRKNIEKLLSLFMAGVEPD